MRLQLYISLFFLAEIGMLAGCSAEGIPEHAAVSRPDNLVDVRFNLTAAPEQVIQTDGDRIIQVETRAGSTPVSTLQDLTILQFDVAESDAGDHDEAKCVTSRWLRAPEPEEGQSYYLIGLQASEKDTQYLIFIANAGSTFQNFEGQTLSRFKEKTIILDQKKYNGENQLMIAAQYTPVKGVDTPEPYTVELQRLVARIDFNYTLGLSTIDATFEPLSLRLMNVPKVLKYADGIEDATDYPANDAGNFENYTSIVSNIEKGFSWYIPQNIRSTTGSAANPWEKTAATSNSYYCTYVELSGIYKAPNMPDQLATYKFFIGENTSDDYNVRRNHSYNITPTLKGVNTFDKRVEKRNIELATSANCFVLSPETGSEVSFNPYKAPGKDVAGTNVVYLDQMVEEQYSRITDVGVVWQTSADLVTVSHEGGIIRIQANTVGTTGNALVAAYDAAGTILWSWHVWVTPYANVLNGTGTSGYIYNFGGYNWMDRNLGALTTERDANNRSLYYQWGRKDPFYDTIKTSISGTGITNEDKGTALNIDESVKSPTVFFTHQPRTNTWHGGEAPIKNLWQAGLKTVFDPCPAGWRVPETACWNDYSWGSNISWDTTNPYGTSLTIGAGTYSWFPIGMLYNTTMVYYNNHCYMWSADWNSVKPSPSVFHFASNGGSVSNTEGSYGGTIRCVKDK